MTRLRIAVVAPLPPGASGAAVDSAMLLPALAQRVDLTVVSAAAVGEQFKAIHPRDLNPAEFDAVVHALGNNVEHLVPYATLLRYGGVAIVHDVAMHAALKRYAPRAWIAALVDALGVRGAAAYLKQEHAEDTNPDVAHPLLGRALCSARAAIVHSEFARQSVGTQAPSLPVYKVPLHHGVELEPSSRRSEVRSSVGAGSSAFVVGAFGNPGPRKQIQTVVAAVAAARKTLLESGVETRLVITGSERMLPPVREMLERDGMTAATALPGRVSDQRFVDLLHAVDVAVSLRGPSGDGSSLTALQALRIGTPLVASSHGAMAELSGAMLLPPGGNETAALTEALVHLGTCLNCRSRLATQGRAAMDAHTLSKCVDAYVDVFRDVAAAPERVTRGSATNPNHLPEPAARVKVRRRKQSLRVAICLPRIGDIVGGAERQCFSLYEALENHGHRPEIVSRPVGLQSRGNLIRSVAAWRCADVSSADLVIATKFPSYFVRHPRKVVWLFHQYRHVTNLLNTKYGAAEVTAADRRWHRAVVRADATVIAEAERTYTTSELVRDRLLETTGLRASLLVPPPPLETRYTHRSYGDYVLCVGRLVPPKRVELLLEAMRHTRGSLRCVIAGTGPQEEVLRGLASNPEIAGRVSLLGAVDNDELASLYADARVLWFGPFDEDLGLVALEAMSACKPVITTTDAGGPLQFVSDGVTGWVVDPTPAAIARAIDQADDVAECARLGGAASSRVADLSWDAVIEELTEMHTQ